MIRGVNAGVRVFEYIKHKSLIPIKVRLWDETRLFLGGDRKRPALTPSHRSLSQGGSKLATVSGNVEFSNVSFAYPTRPEQVRVNGTVMDD